MSDSRDFGQPVKSRAPPSAADEPKSPSTRDYAARDRRGSVRSRLSASSGNGGAGMRFRHPTRSNTVTTYQPEPQNDHAIWQPGQEPGISTSSELVPPAINLLKADCTINIVDFSDTDKKTVQATNDTLAQILEEPRPDDLPCRWISVNGLSWDVIKVVGNKFNLHRLAIEDLIYTHTRTKVDWYADHAFVLLTLQKLVRLHQNWKSESPQDNPINHTGDPATPGPRRRWWQRRPKQRSTSDLPYYLDKDGDGKVDEFVTAHVNTSESSTMKPTRTLHRYESAQIPEHTVFMERHSALAAEDLAVSVEQVAVFLMADNTVISFFEQSAEDVEMPIMDRLQSAETMLRRSCDASLLLQSIIDAIVDLALPVRDAYNKARKELQVDAMTNPNIKTSRALHIFGEEVDMLQNLFKPIVHLVNALRDHNNEPPPPVVHVVQPAQPPNGAPTPGTEDAKEQKEDHIAVQQQQPDPPAQPSRHRPKKETKRDHSGAPSFSRAISDFRRVPLKRSGTNSPTTSVSITPLAHTYFGDVLDHCITMIQSFEQMDASAGNISTLIFNTVGAKTNNFMMILAVVTVFFAPLTFISGYFGMNFASGSGLAHPFSFFWIVAIPSLAGFMLIVFATMLWDNIRDGVVQRDIRIRKVKRDARRRLAS